MLEAKGHTFMVGWKGPTTLGVTESLDLPSATSLLEKRKKNREKEIGEKNHLKAPKAAHKLPISIPLFNM